MGTAIKTSERLATARRAPHIRQGRGLRRILVCVDRSAHSDACVLHAVSMARAFGSSITLLHVMPPHEGHGPRATDPLGWEITRQEATSTLERYARMASESSGIAVDIRLDQGHPAERIAAIARELGIDLIVLGSHGESGVTAWNLGSTALQVLAVAPGSVLIARSNAPALNRILVPLDGSLRTESVLPTVARIAGATDAEVLLAHVVQEPTATAVFGDAADLELARELATRSEAGARRYLASLQEMLIRDVPAVRTKVVRSPDDRQSLLELAESEQADLVVLSAHGCNCNPARPYGSVTAHLLTHAPIPLLVLQDLPEAALLRANGIVADGTSPLRKSLTAERV